MEGLSPAPLTLRLRWVIGDSGKLRERTGKSQVTSSPPHRLHNVSLHSVLLKPKTPSSLLRQSPPLPPFSSYLCGASRGLCASTVVTVGQKLSTGHCVKGLAADVPSSAIRTSSVGVQQGLRLMISEGLKGRRRRASGQEVCRNRLGQEED
ncbi:unnamed protein product [Pleuronectes platessa]|uniref:Uncharacterized protein n=1 Tax=Pleuronectes platessa TaxID=8262 RepID=A0A9N7VJG6_PLEPL|nr:unnamed protein product [Pleuronectes platessa]